jgi:hypothetical protein
VAGQLHEQYRDQRAMHDQARVALFLLGIGPVVVNAMGVER